MPASASGSWLLALEAGPLPAYPYAIIVLSIMVQRNSQSSTKGKYKLPLWFRLFFLFLILAFIAVGSVFGTLLGYEYNLPKIQSLEDYRPDVITEVYADDNQVIGEYAVERRIIVSYDEIPSYLQLAILAAEDDQFYHHSGINYFSLLRAIYKDIIKLSKKEGASTITQQLARMLLGKYDKTFDRKIKELLIAWKIEERYTKQQILTLYCNQHTMGHGNYGVAAAADSYFGKKLQELTLGECALIAGLPRNPTQYSPWLHPESAIARRNYILGRMATEHMISSNLAEEAQQEPLALKPPAQNKARIAPHFLEWVRQSLADRYSTDEIWRRGLKVYTTLDPQMQNAAQKALLEGLRRHDKKRGWRGPIDNALKADTTDLDAFSHPDWRTPLHPGDIVVGLVEAVTSEGATVRIGRYRADIGSKEISWTTAKSPAQILKHGDLAYFEIVSLDDAYQSAEVLLDQRPLTEGAIIILQNSTGEIKAMVGGYDFETSKFNRATQAMRQVGSTFKPIVYAAALEKGISPDTLLLDAPFEYTDELGRKWEPSNYDREFKGQITLREALIGSRNIPTIRLASLIGVDNIVLMARRFRLSGPMDPYLPLAIGACSASPLEMASAFTVFPNLGVQAEPYYIRKVEDYDHEKKEENVPEIRQVLKPDIAQAMLGLLEEVVQSGTAQAAKSLRRPLGGKTGTTNDFTDAWFIGFNPSITAAVWVGYDDNRTLGNRESGAALALPIWIECMREILKNKPIEYFPSIEMTDPIISESPEAIPYGRKHLFVEDLPIAENPPDPDSEKP